MSTNKIDEMTEREAKDLLNKIADCSHIGGKARTASTILTNVENAARRSSCLSMIESFHTVIDEDGNENDGVFECCALNWGEEPEQYIETYKAVISA